MTTKLRIHHDLRNPSMGLRDGETLALTVDDGTWPGPRVFTITSTSVIDDEKAIDLEEL